MLRNISIFLIFVAVVSMNFIACDSATDPSDQGRMTFYAMFSKTPIALNKTSGVAAIDSIQITRARFVMRDIKLKTVSDSLNFKASPFVLVLDLSGKTQEISVKDVPFDLYRRVEFDVHRIEQSDLNSMPTSDKPQFDDFLMGDRYSIIIEGRIFRTGAAAQNFTFRSRDNAKQKYDLVPELLVNASTTNVNVTMHLNSGEWFVSGSTLLDPLDSKNEQVISNNLRSSIRVFKDNNRDGKKDSN